MTQESPVRGIMAAPVSAIVTAYDRIEQTILTIGKIRECIPPPAEILVHVDGNQRECERVIHEAYPDVSIFCNDKNVGPGGGRNILISEAKYPYVASFDDDSYPLDCDYFTRVGELFQRFPNASILSARVFHHGEVIENAAIDSTWVSDFSGGACVYKCESFLATSGYVPLPIAYGMEEVDLALRIHAIGGRVLRTNWLRVYHDTDLKRHSAPAVTAGSIANIALLVYLRYPVQLWHIGLAQLFRRIFWLLRNGRRSGVVAGLLLIPRHLLRNRQYKKPLPAYVVRSYLRLRRNPQGALV